MKLSPVLSRFAVLLLAALSLTAGEVIDRIAAVVNQDVILLSEVDEKLFILEAQGQLKDIDTTKVDKLRHDILDRLIEERLVVQRAKSQGIQVDPEELGTRLRDALANVTSRYPTPEAFQEALRQEGITETMLRERYQSDIEQEFLAQRIVGREVRSKVEVTSEAVKKYFDQNPDQIPRKPSEVELAQIAEFPVNAEQERGALEKIEKARARIVGGESFETVAAEASEDPSRTRGGKLGTFGPGDLDPDFEAAADSLQIGELSPPVRTRFGYHLIEVLSREGDRYEVRHILALVEPKPEDVDAARARAEAALTRVRAGESFEIVAREASDDTASAVQGGALGWTAVQALVPDVGEVVDSLKVGEVSGVVRSDRGFHVFKVLNRRSAGEYTFDEIKDRLRSFLEQQELGKSYDAWMAGVRDSAYIEIKTWER